MRWAEGLAIGLAAFLAGCDNQAQDAADSELKTLQGRVTSLTRENDRLKTSTDTMKAENTSAARKLQALTVENSQLKRQLELARDAAKAASATPAAAAKPVADPNVATTAGESVMGGTAPARPAAAPAAETEAVALERSVTDLEARIADLRPKLQEMRNKVTEISRSTVDVVTPVPAGGVIRGDTVYRKDSLIVAPYFKYTAIGPAVKKGDFRTAAEKEDALHKARDAVTPMDRDLKALQAEQAAAKGKLLKLKVPAQAADPAATPAPEPPAEKPAL